MALPRPTLDVQAIPCDGERAQRLRVALLAAGPDREIALRTSLHGDGERLMHEDLVPGRVLDALAELTPDVVVVDVPTGLVDDLAVIASIAASRPHPSVVVVMSPAGHDLAVQALMAGASGLVWRDEPGEALRQAVASVAHGEAVVPGDVTMALLRRLHDAASE